MNMHHRAESDAWLTGLPATCLSYHTKNFGLATTYAQQAPPQALQRLGELVAGSMATAATQRSVTTDMKCFDTASTTSSLDAPTLTSSLLCLMYSLSVGCYTQHNS